MSRLNRCTRLDVMRAPINFYPVTLSRSPCGAATVYTVIQPLVTQMTELLTQRALRLTQYTQAG